MLTTRTVNLADAQRQLPQIIAEVCNGAEVVIAHGPTPVARLTAIAQPAAPRHAQQADDANWEEAIATIAKLRKNAVIGPPLTLDEILSARDEGRR